MPLFVLDAAALDRVGKSVGSLPRPPLNIGSLPKSAGIDVVLLVEMGAELGHSSALFSKCEVLPGS